MWKRQTLIYSLANPRLILNLWENNENLQHIINCAKIKWYAHSYPYTLQCAVCALYTLTYSTYVKLPSKCCKKSCGIIQFRNWQNIFFRISQIFVSLKILILSYSKIFIRFYLRWIIRKLKSRNQMALSEHCTLGWSEFLR